MEEHRRFPPAKPQSRTLLYILVAAVLLVLLQRPSVAAPTSSSSTGPHGLQSWFQSKLIQGFQYAVEQLSSLPPLAGQLVTGLQRRRLARGDLAGAARLENLKGWSSYLGLYRGVPALLADLARNRGLVAEIIGDWSRLMERARAVQGGGSESWPELLIRERAGVLDWARRSLHKARRAFRGGAISRLLSDLHLEFTTDRHFVSDLMAELEVVYGYGSGAVSEQLTALVQQVFEAVREALFPGASPSRRPGSGTEGTQRHPRHRQHGQKHPSSTGRSAGGGGSAYYNTDYEAGEL